MEHDRIIDLLRMQPGLRARDIAEALSLDTHEVNQVLYGRLRNQVQQDSSYRWRLRDGSVAGQISKTPSATQPPTPLSRLCKYYLECLAHDLDNGVSVWASSRFDNLDYAPLSTFPLLGGNSSPILDAPGARRLFDRMRKDRNRLQPLIGYPVFVNHIKARNGGEYFKVEPLFLFPLNVDPHSRDSAPEFAEEGPHVNFDASRSIALGAITGERGPDLLQEAIQLQEDLGLVGGLTALPDMDDIALRLMDVRREWPWKEQLDPANLTPFPSLSDVTVGGIYNRAVLVLGERSPYTAGLEVELAQLANVPESTYTGTALGAWLKGSSLPNPIPPNEPLLEILPLNVEQRDAVERALVAPLTVVTGPPGTGKSQVVSSILVNAGWRGLKVLFASKNNKAVDVVEERTNGLGPRRVLLRVGPNKYQDQLAEYLTAVTSTRAEADDVPRYDRLLAEHQQVRTMLRALDDESAKVVELRNQVHVAERAADETRNLLGEETFRALRDLDINQHRHAVQELQAAVKVANKRNYPLLIRWSWAFVKKGRFTRAAKAVQSVQYVSQLLGAPLPELPFLEANIPAWNLATESLVQRVKLAEQAQRYWEAFKALSESRSLESIANEQMKIIQELANTSLELWQTWLRLLPNRMSIDQRRLLGEYTTLLKMIIASGQRTSPQVRQRFNELFPKVSDLLPCWAVTSLSARGRLPFEPGFFDLVVIDEASQCDIASALPLLYRAKRAVIIGDPKQLQHITQMTELQDQQLLQKYDLLNGYAQWSYSQNSLYILASSSLVDANALVDLLDHHRSHADIIGFSNEHFYQGRLRVATRHDRLRLPPGKAPVVRWVDVRGHVIRPAQGSAVNEVEARAVVQELRRLLVEQGYKGSVGVVTPFRPHANFIKDLMDQDDALRQHVLPADLLVDVVHSFQGDERDVMLFSPVVAEGIGDGALRFLRNNGNLFNVANTRARATFIVVGDRNAALASGVAYLSKYVTYVDTLGVGRNVPIATPPDEGGAYPKIDHVVNKDVKDKVSDWERVLYQALYSAGIRPFPQYSVPPYWIDLAVMGNGRKLAVEVDGEHDHRAWDGELRRRDQIRNQRLIEQGWDVMRFWVYQVRDNLESCVGRVQEWVNKAGI